MAVGKDFLFKILFSFCRTSGLVLTSELCCPHEVHWQYISVEWSVVLLFDMVSPAGFMSTDTAWARAVETELWKGI